MESARQSSSEICRPLTTSQTYFFPLSDNTVTFLWQWGPLLGCPTSATNNFFLNLQSPESLLTSPWASETWFKRSFSTQHSLVFAFTQCVQLSRRSMCWFSFLNVIQLLLQIKVSFVVQFKLHSVKTLAIHLSLISMAVVSHLLQSLVFLAILLKHRGQAFPVLKESTIPPLGQHSAFHWAQLLTRKDWIHRENDTATDRTRRGQGDHSGAHRLQPKGWWGENWREMRRETVQGAGDSQQRWRARGQEPTESKKAGGAAGEAVWCFWLSCGSPNLVLPTHPLEQ